MPRAADTSLPLALTEPAPPADAEFQATLGRFVAACEQALAAGEFDHLMLAGYHGPEADLQRVLVRPVVLKGRPHLSVVHRHTTRDLTHNLPVAQAWPVLMALVGRQGFRNAHLHRHPHPGGGELQLAVSKKGKATLRRGATSAPGHPDTAQAHTNGGATPPAHNREKVRLVEVDRPFLQALGVTDAQSQLVPTMARKFKQINKFVEVFSHALVRSPLAERRALQVVDFGSGKGYLTFALHDWLTHVRGVQATVTGVELRPELVAFCQGVIARLGLQGMACEQGDVRHYHPAQLDVVVALHACDIATDFALDLGIRAGASIILSSPCCHKEVRPQLLSPHPLRPILQHGIHLGQQAEMLTDGLRALLLEAAGYDTQVFEFVSLEHTNKNKMILAVRRAERGDVTDVLQQIADIKAFYGIRAQTLETLLQQQGLLTPA